LMHLVGYLYEDYHDARSREHKLSINFSAEAEGPGLMTSLSNTTSHLTFRAAVRCKIDHIGNST
jgi:hypothetical protein